MSANGLAKSEAASKKWARADILSVIAIIFSVVSGVYGYWITDKVRLDSKRHELRADSVEQIDALQRQFALVNCSYVSLGRTIPKESDGYIEIETGIRTSRENLKQIDGWGDTALDIHRDTVTSKMPAFIEKAKELEVEFRARLSETDLAKIDRICKL